MLITLSQNASSALSDLLQNAANLHENPQVMDKPLDQIATIDICVRIQLKCFG